MHRSRSVVAINTLRLRFASLRAEASNGELMILDLFKLDGKFALVTGAGQGLAPTLYRDI